MIKIDHIAVWVQDLERMKDFYVRYFNMQCSERYHNPVKQFSSYFLSSEKDGTRIELMTRADITTGAGERGAVFGWAHIAISVGSKEQVDALTAVLRADQYRVESGPRVTGDGYYESVIADPEGNLIEITI